MRYPVLSKEKLECFKDAIVQAVPLFLHFIQLPSFRETWQIIAALWVAIRTFFSFMDKWIWTVGGWTNCAGLGKSLPFCLGWLKVQINPLVFQVSQKDFEGFKNLFHRFLQVKGPSVEWIKIQRPPEDSVSPVCWGFLCVCMVLYDMK